MAESESASVGHDFGATRSIGRKFAMVTAMVPSGARHRAETSRYMTESRGRSCRFSHRRCRRCRPPREPAISTPLRMHTSGVARGAPESRPSRRGRGQSKRRGVIRIVSNMSDLALLKPDDEVMSNVIFVSQAWPRRGRRRDGRLTRRCRSFYDSASSPSMYAWITCRIALISSRGSVALGGESQPISFSV